MKRKSNVKKYPFRKLGIAGTGRTFLDAKVNMIARRVAKQTFNRNVESKESVSGFTDGTEILHNSFVILRNDLVYTTQGVQDPSANNANNRIGDEINLQSVTIKMMLELNERFSDVTFRLLIIKSAKGDVPTRATLFKGQSGNKMLDTIDTERYTVMKQRWIKMKAPNNGTVGTNLTTVLPPSSIGTSTVNDGQAVQSRATKIVTMVIPGSKFRKGGKIIYESGTSQPKFYDYHALLYAYSNFTTSQDLVNVGRVNDCFTIMKYKDA